MARRRLRLALVAGYLLIALATGVALWGFATEANQRLGADHTAAASDIVRGQQQVAALRRAANALREAPSRFHQQRMLSALNDVSARATVLRSGLQRLGLARQQTAEARAALEQALAELPALRLLTRRVLEAPERLGAFIQAATRVETQLAFAYSTLHAMNHRASAAQQRLAAWLALVVSGLGTLLLLIIGALVVAVNATLRQRDTLEQLTVTDHLTGLPNRRALLQRADWVLAQHRRNGRPVSLALIDVDHFKAINDRDGHPAGDRALHQLAERLTALVRAADMVARLGGEEFGLLMPDTGEAESLALCERIRARIEGEAYPWAPHFPRLTVSIGVATSTPGTETLFDRLYSRADRALYEAKRGGRNRVVAAMPAQPPPAPAGDQALAY